MNTDDAITLLAAIISQWIKDAHRDPRERYLLARFLSCDPADIDRFPTLYRRRSVHG